MPIQYKKEGFIYVTFDVEGYHSWPNAPEEVAFLRNMHRHMFKFKATLGVNHDDREVEFFMFQREVSKSITCVDNKSCEMLARELCEYISSSYPGRYVEVEVSEDGENGAIVAYTPTNQPGKAEA